MLYRIGGVAFLSRTMYGDIVLVLERMLASCFEASKMYLCRSAGNSVASMLTAACFVIGLALPLPLVCFAKPPPSAESEVEKLRRLVEAQERQNQRQQGLLEEQMRKLKAQQQELNALKRRLAAASLAPSRISSDQTGRTPGSSPRRDANDLDAAVVAPPPAGPKRKPMELSRLRGGQQQGTSPERQQVGERPREERKGRSQPLSVASVIREQSILTPKGTFTLTPSLAYINDSNVRTAVTGFSVLPALLVGIFDVRKINRDTLIARLTGRYGVTEKSDIELRIPYVYRSDSVRSRPLGTPTVEDTRFTASGNDIGDIEAAIRYQFNRPSPKWPYLTGGLRIKSRTGKSPYDFDINPRSRLPEGGMPTGTGFWGIKPGLFFLYPSDPVVYFAELSYQWNLEDKIRNGATVNPGDYVGADFGMGFALNEKASFTLGYQHRTVLKTTVDGEAVGDTLQVGSYVTSFSYQYAKNASVNLSIAGGLTEDAPDLQVTLSFPISFGS